MREKVDLRLDWCSYEAAKYAVEHWHYSRVLPYGKLVKIGVWEDGFYIGCVLFSMGANKNIGSPYNMEMTEVCELTRVALKEHKTSVSKILSISIKMLKKQSPGIRLIVSYADTEQEHLGIIYQANNWLYVGTVKTTPYHFVNGRWMKQRMASAALGSIVGTERRAGFSKIKYLFPLDNAIRKQIEPLRKPYPKRDTGEIDSAPQSNAETEGASPIVSL